MGQSDFVLGHEARMTIDTCATGAWFDPDANDTAENQ
jgi:hypothetical protein